MLVIRCGQGAQHLADRATRYLREYECTLHHRVVEMRDVLVAMSTNRFCNFDRRHNATPQAHPHPRLSFQGRITKEDSHCQVVKGADSWRIGEARDAEQNLSNEEALCASKEPVGACIEHRDPFRTMHEKSLILSPGIEDESELAEKLVARPSELGRRNLKALENGRCLTNRAEAAWCGGRNQDQFVPFQAGRRAPTASRWLGTARGKMSAPRVADILHRR